jgi:hypothetical protein
MCQTLTEDSSRHRMQSIETRCLDFAILVLQDDSHLLLRKHLSPKGQARRLDEKFLLESILIEQEVYTLHRYRLTTLPKSRPLSGADHWFIWEMEIQREVLTQRFEKR